MESLKDEYEEVMTGSPTSSNVADFSYQSPFTASTGLSALNSAMPRYAGYFDSDSDGKLS